jgi:hypothetical protein
MTRSIRTTLAGAFAALTLVILAMSGFSFVTMRELDALSTEVTASGCRVSTPPTR